MTTTKRVQQPPARRWHRAIVCVLAIFVAVLAVDSSLINALQTTSGTPAPDASPLASPDLRAATPSATPVATPLATPETRAASEQGIVPGGRQRLVGQIRAAGRISVDGSGFGRRPSRRTGLTERSVYDPYRLLTSEQREVVERDAERLTEAGVPVLVYVRISESNEEQRQEFAARVLDEWQVESAPGADDGMVILVSMGVTARQSGDVTIHTGSRTLPSHGLTADTVRHIAEREMAPRVEDGEVYSALLIALRSFIYLLHYYPEQPEPPSAIQQRLADVLSWLAPAIGLLVLATVLASWFRPGFPHRLAGDRFGRWLLPLLGTAFCVLVAVISVYAESRIGIAMVLLVALALLLTWMIHPGAAHAGPHAAVRSITVRPWRGRDRVASLARLSGPTPAAAAGDRRAGHGPRRSRLDRWRRFRPME